MEALDSFFERFYEIFLSGQTHVVTTILNIFWDDPGIEKPDAILSNLYCEIGLTTLIVSLLVAIAYYIWPINHPRFKSWWSWLIMMGLNMLISFGVASLFLYNRVTEINTNEKYHDSFMDQFNGASHDGNFVFSPDNSVTSFIDINFSQYFEFGMANVCVCAIFFVLCSLMLNWFSTNAKFSPIRK